MIGDPPLLKIRRNFERPGADLLAAFAGAATGHVVDAMNGRGALDKRVKPLQAPAISVVGTALTCLNSAGDNLGLFAALDVARAGDVVVASSSAYSDTAMIGDLLAGMLRNAAVAALVTDGAIRDLAGVQQVGLPVFCTAVTPNSPVRNGPGTVGFPVVVGREHVASGDIIVADADGVVVVPRDVAPTVAAALDGIRTAEAELEAKVAAGLKIPDFVRTILNSDRVIDIA